jgi:lipopolysaccharide/colanic/teichoic acid biosynthesis glycosyltransferase
MSGMTWSSGNPVKRSLDIIGAAAALLIAAPIIAGSALAIWISMGSPVFFRQERAGRDGRLFRVVKLRTMSCGPRPDGKTASDEHRLTREGSFLRRTSLDELPQLWNVLKGDMSLVGPRPLLPQYLARYTAFQRRRHEVRPGITGWAQVHGRNRLSWEKKFEYDVWYVDHCGPWLDLKILALTVKQVLRRDGISQQGHATAQEFLGTEETSKAK